MDSANRKIASDFWDNVDIDLIASETGLTTDEVDWVVEEIAWAGGWDTSRYATIESVEARRQEANSMVRGEIDARGLAKKGEDA